MLTKKTNTHLSTEATEITILQTRSVYFSCMLSGNIISNTGEFSYLPLPVLCAVKQSNLHFQ